MKNLNSIFLAALMMFYGTFVLNPALVQAKNDKGDNGNGNDNKPQKVEKSNWGSFVSSIRSNSKNKVSDFRNAVPSFYKNFGSFVSGFRSDKGHNDENNNENKNESYWNWQPNRSFSISDIVVTPSGKTAVISWNTSTSTNGTVSYGTSYFSLPNSISEASGVFSSSHQLTLAGLSPNTRYYYSIKTQNADSTVVKTVVRTFKTSTTTVATANVTTNAATNITTTSATVNGTNGPAAASGTSFWIGTTSAGPFTAAADPTSQLPSGWYGIDSLAQSANGSFSYNYTGLAENTTYYFVAWSNIGGTWYPGAVLSFTTGTISSDTTSPDIVFSTNIGLSASTTSIIWVTDEASDSKVWVDTVSPVSTTTAPVASSGTLSYFHQLSIPNLATSTLYYYTVSSSDASSNTSYYSSSFTSPSN
jgi:hypothetical protein